MATSGNLSAVAALEVLLASLELDEACEMNAAIARALAGKLDEARRDSNGAVAMAISGIAKELRAVVDSILEATANDDEFVADLFAPVGDAAESGATDIRSRRG